MTNDAPYTFAIEQRYQKQARKSFRQHPDLRPIYDRLLADLAINPFAPALKIHPLSGRLERNTMMCIGSRTLSYPPPTAERKITRRG